MLHRRGKVACHALEAAQGCGRDCQTFLRFLAHCFSTDPHPLAHLQVSQLVQMLLDDLLDARSIRVLADVQGKAQPAPGSAGERQRHIYPSWRELCGSQAFQPCKGRVTVQFP